jgi:diguanylate cyclase (GGDEF)-like protein
VLAGKGAVESLAGGGAFVDVALSVALIGLISSAVLNARAAGIEGERRSSESESFSRIMRALSRSVSPDAVVEAIVHELGAATEADHVSVVLLRPGGSVLDVTFVSMLPGAPTSYTVMPLRQLEPIETPRPPGLPRPQQSGSPTRLVDDAPTQLWRDGRERSADSASAANEDTASLRRSGRVRPRGAGSIEDEARAREVADRIAYRLREAYGIHNTVASPLHAGSAIAGAIVLSHRTSGIWPETAVRLLDLVTFEASAALARVYSHQAAESEARTDQLTQLPNRRYFDEYCTLMASRRRSSDRVSIVAVDVDYFKLLNDTYGHQVGDVVLRSIGNAIQASVRDEDVPARYGGEEFMVLLRNPGVGVALEIGERIRQSVRDMDLAEAGVTDRVTVSVGVASSHTAGETIDEIVERADRALYTAKRTGRDRVVEAQNAAVDE